MFVFSTHLQRFRFWARKKNIYTLLGSREVSRQFHFIDEKAEASIIEQFAQDI